MLGYSGCVAHSDYFIDVHETKESAIEFLKRLAYESDEKRFVVGVAVKKEWRNRIGISGIVSIQRNKKEVV